MDRPLCWGSQPPRMSQTALVVRGASWRMGMSEGHIKKCEKLMARKEKKKRKKDSYTKKSLQVEKDMFKIYQRLQE